MSAEDLPCHGVKELGELSPDKVSMGEVSALLHLWILVGFLMSITVPLTCKSGNAAEHTMDVLQAPAVVPHLVGDDERVHVAAETPCCAENATCGGVQEEAENR